MSTIKISDTNLDDRFYDQNPNFDFLSVYFHNPSELSQLETQLQNAGVTQTDIGVRSPPPLLAIVAFWLLFPSSSYSPPAPLLAPLLLQFPSWEGLGVGWARGGSKTLTLSLFMKTKIIPYNPLLKERARQLRQNMTPGEVTLWKYLKGKQMCGYDFDRQRPIDQFIVDFYCKKLMLAIEIDASCHDREEAQERDRERQACLESLGVRFLRFQEEEVCGETEGVVRVIEEWISSHA